LEINGGLNIGMKRIAIIMSGHARMVPQGHHMIDQTFKTTNDREYSIFSMTWTDGDQRSSQFSPNDEKTDEILRELGNRSVRMSQVEKLRDLHEKFLNAGAIPRPTESMLNFDAFSKYTGQIWGFLAALDHWREELLDFDVIVRSRWDRLLDPACIDAILGNRPFRGDSDAWMITCDVSVNDGQLYYSGDVIYGPAKKWLDLIPSEAIATNRCIAAVKRWYLDNINNPDSVLHRREEKWFTSHWLWTTIFDGTDVSMAGFGNCYAIHPNTASIPLHQLNERMISNLTPALPPVPSWKNHGTNEEFFFSICNQENIDLNKATQWCREHVGVEGKVWEMTVVSSDKTDWHFKHFHNYHEFKLAARKGVLDR
jgi:hypothetical protein